MKRLTITKSADAVVRPTIICLTALVAIQLVGCSPPRTVRPVHLILNTDVSGSISPYLPAYARLNSQLAARLDPDNDFLTAYRTDCASTCYFDDHAPESQDDFQEVTIHALSAPPGRPGTFPALAWTAMAGKAADAGSRDVEVVVETDGDDDQNTRASRDAVRAAASRLAANRHVRAVAVVGVSPANWDALAKQLSPLKEKVRIFGPKQISADDVGRFLDEEGGRQ